MLFAGVGAYTQHAGSIQHASPSQMDAIRLYLAALSFEWVSVYYVWKGTRRSVPLAELIGPRWRGLADVLRDIALAGGFWSVWIWIQLLLPSGPSIATLLPRTLLEFFVWMFVAGSAGFCEELVFRGYFQRQFHALTGNRNAGIALQALLFGVAHLYQGPWAVVKITLYGVLFGALAAKRGSLKPGMIGHAWSDIFAVLGRVRM